MGIKYAVNSNYFKKWTAEMAYVLGFIYADGSMYPSSRGKYVAVTSTDKPIIFKIKKWLNSEHSITTAPPIWENGKLRFGLRIGNKELYDSLIRHGLYPNKSLTIKMPKVPLKYLSDFVRGYFDGDGCVNLYRSKGIKQKIILRKLSVIFTSGSKEFLEGLLSTLRSCIQITQNKIYNSQRSFQLRLATADSVIMFKFMYKNIPSDTYFLRKYNIFAGYFKLRPQRIDKGVEIILQSLSHGHVAK